MYRRSIFQTCVLPVIFIIALVVSSIAVPRESTAEDFRQRGRDAFDEGRYSVSERPLRLALAEFETRSDSIEIAETLGDLATVLIAQERYSQAEPLLVRALASLPTETVGHAGTTSRLLANVGALYVQTGRDEEAESA